VGKFVVALVFCGAVLVDERSRHGRRFCVGSIRANVVNDDIRHRTVERDEGVALSVTSLVVQFVTRK